MNTSIEHLVSEFIKNNSDSSELQDLTNYVTLGFVVSDDDELQNGRLQIFCPAYNDDPKKLLQLPWAVNGSSTGGVIDNESFARGSTPGNEGSKGAVHYGMWIPPTIGAHALVVCINGDPRRRVYIGCVPSHQETHTLGNGRYKHADNAVDGPLSSTGDPIEPANTNLKAAFSGDIKSPEWKTRGADYQISAVTGKITDGKESYTDDDYEAISGSEADEWVKSILGEHGYDWSGFKNLGSILSPRAHTWTTPGFHNITMDDRPFNSRVKLRSSSGHQIILDDTNERIYAAVAGGKAWIEMDVSGNIDIYGERNLSVRTKKSLNFSADESIRFKAGEYISMYAGNTIGQEALAEAPSTGEIRFHSASTTQIKVEGDLKMNVGGSWHTSVAGDYEMKIDGGVVFESVSDIKFTSASLVVLDTPDVKFRVNGKDTTVTEIVDFFDALTDHLNAFIGIYNGHKHDYTLPSHSAGTGPTDVPGDLGSDKSLIVDAELVENPDPTDDDTQLAPWTNRVPAHEPWSRVMMIDTGDEVNAKSSGPSDNVDWVEQFDNVGEDGRKPIGKVEGDEDIDRGELWRR